MSLGGWTTKDIGTKLSWPDIKIVMKHGPADSTSALFREMHPEDHWFGPEEQFQAAILHAVQSGNWQRGGGKGSRPTVFEPKHEHKAKPGSTVPIGGIKDELEERRRRIRERKAREAQEQKGTG